MSIRFQADADLNHILIKAVLRREPMIDFQTSEAAGIRGLSDPEVLEFAAREHRLLVTHDRKTMPKHFADFVEHTDSYGVIVVPQRLAISSAVDDLVLIWAASEVEEWVNKIQSLPL